MSEVQYTVRDAINRLKTVNALGKTNLLDKGVDLPADEPTTTDVVDGIEDIQAGISGGYSVLFKNGDADYYFVSVSQGDNIDKPLTDPTRGSDGFNGWYDEETGGNKITFPFTPVENTTLYAQFVPFTFVSWSEGTDLQISMICDALENEIVTISDLNETTNNGWSVGCERTVSLSAMDATGVGESHAAQDISLVLMNTGATNGLSRVDGKDIHFIVGQKNCLNESGYMNPSDTSSGSWKDCKRRVWCNNVYYNAIPDSIRQIFRQMNVTTGTGVGLDTVTITQDYVALPAEKEVHGIQKYAPVAEANALSQMTWYQTSANRYKNMSTWWERGVRTSSSFCITRDGSPMGYNAATLCGISPFMCI